MPTEPFFAGGGVFTIFVIAGGRSLLRAAETAVAAGSIYPYLMWVLRLLIWGSPPAFGNSAWNCQFGGLRLLLAIRPQLGAAAADSFAHQQQRFEPNSNTWYIKCWPLFFKWMRSAIKGIKDTTVPNNATLPLMTMLDDPRACSARICEERRSLQTDAMVL